MGFQAPPGRARALLCREETSPATVEAFLPQAEAEVPRLRTRGAKIEARIARKTRFAGSSSARAAAHLTRGGAYSSEPSAPGRVLPSLRFAGR